MLLRASTNTEPTCAIALAAEQATAAAATRIAGQKDEMRLEGDVRAREEIGTRELLQNDGESWRRLDDGNGCNERYAMAIDNQRRRRAAISPPRPRRAAAEGEGTELTVKP